MKIDRDCLCTLENAAKLGMNNFWNVAHIKCHEISHVETLK